MEPGTFLGRYKLGPVLGSGAMGEVYQATDPKLNGRKVAIKTILKSRMLDPKLAAEYSERFDREAAFVSSLTHPNIVTVHDFGNEAEVAYLVMEFIDGKELKTFLDAKHVFAIDEAVAIICQLLEALAYAHERFIFHRDIKPANIMIDGHGWVKLTDFGVARQSDGSHEATLAGGTQVGTPSYMSPEQIKGIPAVAAADLFATGVVLYQCLALHKPFVGESAWEIWDQTVNADPPPLSTYRAGVPPALERAMLHALAKQAKNRPVSALAMIAELKAAIAGENFDADATRIVSGAAAASARDGSSLAVRAAGGSLPFQGSSIGAGSRMGGSAGSGNTGMSMGTGAGTSMGGGSAIARETMSHQNSEIELEFWRSIKDSGDPEEFQLFLERFPGGNYSDLARRKMSKLATVGMPAMAPMPAMAAGAAVGAEETDASFARKIAEQEEHVRRLKADQERRLAEAARERELQLQLQRDQAQRQEQARAAALAVQQAAKAAEQAAALAEQEAQRQRDEAAELARIHAQQRAAADAEAKRIKAEQEAARIAAADAEAKRIKAEQDAARIAATDAEAKRIKAEQDAASIAAADAEAKRIEAAEREAARIAAADAEAKRIEAEQEAARIAAADAEVKRIEADDAARAQAAEREAARLQAIEAAAERDAARLKAAEQEAAERAMAAQAAEESARRSNAAADEARRSAKQQAAAAAAAEKARQAARAADDETRIIHAKDRGARQGAADAAKAAAAENARLEECAAEQARQNEQARQQEQAEEQARRAEQIVQREPRAVAAAPERTVASAGIGSGQGAPRPVPAPSKAPLIIGGAVALLVLVGAGVMLTSKKDAAAPTDHLPVLVTPAASASASAPVIAAAPVSLPKAPIQAGSQAGSQSESRSTDGPIRADSAVAAKTKEAASLAATQASAVQARKELADKKAGDDLRLREDARIRALAGQRTLDDASKAAAARDDEAKKIAADQAKAKEDAAIAAAKKSASEQARAKDDAAAKAVRDLVEQKAKDEDAAKRATAAAAAAAVAAAAPKPKADPEALFAQAQKAQQEGNGRAAVDLYKQAFSAGNGRAARSLAEMYGRGSGGVDRDYAESVQWTNKAKAAGIDMPIPGKRN